jgi:hypothetical protein
VTLVTLAYLPKNASQRSVDALLQTVREDLDGLADAGRKGVRRPKET